MIRGLGQVFVRWVRRWMPDPFVLALGLTALTFLLGVVATEHGPTQMLEFWTLDFWAFLPFSMQMCLILVTGHALARAPTVRATLNRLAEMPRSAAQATALVAVLACAAAWINWGFGLIVGALMAREVGVRGERRGLKLHYPLLGAAGYTGMVIWHGGLSGSAPLKVAEQGHFLADKMGVVGLGETVLTPANLLVTAILLVVIPAVLVALIPEEKDRLPASRFLSEERERTEDASPETTPAGRLENSPSVGVAIALPGLLWWLYSQAQQFDLNINTVNFLFLFLGLLLHGSPKAYADAIAEGVRGVAGIVLQFPFYAGIMGMMKHSGLLALIAGGFTSLSDIVLAWTGLQVFPVLSFLSAGLVNLFVPSGGGQWGVQGPIAVEAASHLGLDPAIAVLSVAYGDQWTNLLQPFWALPLLGLTRLEARDLIGYTIPVLLVTGVVFVGGLMLM